MADVPNAAKEFADQIRGELVATKQALQTELMKSLDERDSRLIEKLGKQFADQHDEFIQKMNAQQGAFRVPGLSNDDSEVKKFKIARLIQGIAKGNPQKYAPHEVEMCSEAAAATDPAELERMIAGGVNKEMVAGTDASGGFLIPAQVYLNEIIPLLQPRVIAFKLGVRYRTGLKGSPAQWPRIITDVDMEEVGETEAASGDELTFGQMQLTPHRFSQYVTLSNDLITQSPAEVENIVNMHLVSAVGRKINRWIFDGSGASGQPIGLFQADDVNSVTSFGDLDADTAWNKLTDMRFKIEEDDADVYTAEPKWAFNPIHLRDLENMLDPTNNSQPKARKILTEGALKSVRGYGFEKSTLIPVTKFAFGYWESVIFGQWGTLVLAASNVAGNNFRNRTTEVMAYGSGDVGFEHPQSLCIATGVTQT